MIGAAYFFIIFLLGCLSRETKASADHYTVDASCGVVISGRAFEVPSHHDGDHKVINTTTIIPFYGIKFGEAERWKPPEPVPCSTRRAPFYANEFGPMCVQPSGGEI